MGADVVSCMICWFGVLIVSIIDFEICSKKVVDKCRRNVGN